MAGSMFGQTGGFCSLLLLPQMLVSKGESNEGDGPILFFFFFFFLGMGGGALFSGIPPFNVG